MKSSRLLDELAWGGSGMEGGQESVPEENGVDRVWMVVVSILMRSGCP